MKKFLIILFLIPSFFSFSQQNGNEWIDFSQQYFKIPIYKTGIHRLDYLTIKTTLFNVGINVSSIPANDFQIFGREKEIPLYVEDGNDGFLNSDDYIEFYAQKNDSWLDSLVYESSDYVPDPYYSLFNDTIRYYLTWTSQTNGLRMQEETAVNFNSFNPIDFCWTENHVKYNSDYSLGEQLDNLSSPLFEKGEGWVGTVHTKGNSYDETIPTNNFYPNSPVGKARMTVVSSNSVVPQPPANPPLDNHNTKIYFNNNLIIDSSYYGYEKINFEFPLNSVSNNSTVTHEISSIGQGNDRQHISEITIWYAHTFNFNGDSTFKFGIPNNSQSNKSRIDFSNLNSSVVNPILYVINNGTKRVKVNYSNTNGQVLVPNSTTGDSTICFIVDSLNFISINELNPINGNGYFRDLNSLNLTDAFVIISHEKLMPTAIDYGAYRSSDYDTVVINIEELYHQFGGGIYLHPLSIKRFMKMTMNEWNSWPSHLFLVGNSISNVPGGSAGLISPRNDATVYKNCLVPTFGVPGSDNHFTVGIDPNIEGFAIPTGRRSANSLYALNSYFNKVQDYENQQDQSSTYSLSNKEWQKKILHFGGGADSTEQAYISNWLSYFENSIEDTLFGGDVCTFSKDPFSSTLNNNDFQLVSSLLEDGVSLITFFGHSSSANGFSQNIDSPDSWNNQGKYPLVIGIGCYTGDVHQIDSTVYAEKLLAPENEGAIGFISTIKQGITPFTNQYVDFLYHYISSKAYGKTIGQQMKMTVDSIDQFTSGIYWNPIYQSIYNGMSLQGDPAIKLNYHNFPEIVLDESRVWQDPSAIDLSVDTFSLFIVVTNIGKAFNDSLNISIQRQYPNGQDSLYNKTIKGVSFRDTIEFKMPTDLSISIGINNFTIQADLPFSQIVEQQDEFINNEISKTIIISSNAILPIWPYDYSIIGDQIINLKGSTMNPFEPQKNYLFEIDTTDEFNSPFKKRQEIISLGGVVEAYPNNWKNSNTLNPEPLFFTDSTVYFWRCAPDSSQIQWEESSFQYIPKKWGWGQSHFFQFKNNSYSNINYNRPSRVFEFQPSITKITIDTYSPISTWNNYISTSWTLGGAVKSNHMGWLETAVGIIVIDGATLEAWSPGKKGCFGQANGGSAYCPGTNGMGVGDQHVFFFETDNPAQLDSLVDMINNDIPDSSYIMLYSYYQSFVASANMFANWPTSLFSTINSLGGSGFNNQTQQDDAFIFFCKKGDLTSAVTTRSINPVFVNNWSASPENLHFETYINGSTHTGLISTPEIGPASNWHSLYWQQHPRENNSADTTRLILYGKNNLDVEQIIFDTLLTKYDSVVDLTSLIDPTLYPFLRLQANLTDTLDLTPAQIERWQLIYDPVPELAVNPKKGYYLNVTDQGMDEGDSIEFAVAIENISAFDMDSLLVGYKIYDETFNNSLINYPRQDSLKSGEVFIDTLIFSSKNFQGNNNLWITANPINYTTNQQDQLEQFYFNNILQTNFKILEDNTNPILDVTFDGFHILNNDIVSPSPYIVISLDDENEFLLLNEDTDTSNFSVHILYPTNNSWQRVYFMNSEGEEILKFFPATNSKNKCRIEFNPTFITDGNYSLKVQARDKKNNYSGDSEYQIDFEVITTSSLTNIYNYPNPFSTKTHFVFTLTGSVFPDDMLIQIFNVSGKIVKEISMSEIGALKIGHNKTDYFWNGRDNYGDLLANGVYFYKVTAKINGENIEHRETSGDHAFTKGFGKMYLLR